MKNQESCTKVPAKSDIFKFLQAVEKKFPAEEALGGEQKKMLTC